ncbi:MAG: hypothetical protein KTR18_04985 [Acidiferrobacterales bacterium]|nr:hypothetical protein [Acidiferrobacterales bacterium]
MNYLLPLSIFIALVWSSGIANARLIKGQSLLVDALSRTYDLYIHTKRSCNSQPLDLLLHGHLGNAYGMTGENNMNTPYKVWLDIS